MRDATRADKSYRMCNGVLNCPIKQRSELISGKLNKSKPNGSNRHDKQKGWWKRAHRLRYGEEMVR